MTRHDWTTAEVEEPVRPAVPRSAAGSAARASAALRAQHRADEHAAVDQDRRLPRGLRLLPAERALRHRAVARGADGSRGRARQRAEARRRPAPRASAWARPTARPRRAISRSSAPWSARCARWAWRPAPPWACSSPRRHSSSSTPGLDFYNHNLDTSEEFYGEIITTRTFQDRLDTLSAVRDAGLKVCCGGIVGMGETTRDRASMLATLASLPQHPESVPINELVQVPGTPLHGVAPVDPFDFVRTIAVARIVLPRRARAAVGRPHPDERRDAGAVLHGRRQLHFLRREAAHHRQSGRREGPQSAGAPGAHAGSAAATRARARIRCRR